jgi:hypothetical protein
LFGPRGGGVRTRIYQRVILAPGANTWSLALATGSVRIDGVPRLVATRDAREEKAHYALVARLTDERVWIASILHADPGSLTILDVPAGAVKLLQVPADASSLSPPDAWPVVRELEVLANAEARTSLP